MALPRFIVLRSKYNNKHLRYIPENGEAHRLIKVTGNEVTSPYAKFEVEMSKTRRGLVHIRCCYNNRYWVRWSADHVRITPKAEQPEEDESKWSCTLFEPVYVGGDTKTVRFRHVQLKRYAKYHMVGNPLYDESLFAVTENPSAEDVFMVVDWDELVILPKYVAFKGHNGCYLGGYWWDGRKYLELGAVDIRDPRVWMEATMQPHGNVRLWSRYYQGYWRRSPNWIWADSQDPTNSNPDTCFVPVKLGKNVIALRNVGNNWYCRRLTTEGKINCLNAGTSTIIPQAYLEVEELVLSREIYNVHFHILDARIYNQTIVTLATGEAINKTQEPNTVELRFSYTDEKSSTWNANVSLTIGITASFSAGVPIIGNTEVEISTQFTTGYEWGETYSTSSTKETVYTVIVPPMTKVKVALLATRASCDVPFSYTQRDVLVDGRPMIYHKDDGVYTGTNSFNFQYEAEQFSL